MCNYVKVIQMCQIFKVHCGCRHRKGDILGPRSRGISSDGRTEPYCHQKEKRPWSPLLGELEISHHGKAWGSIADCLAGRVTRTLTICIGITVPCRGASCRQNSADMTIKTELVRAGALLLERAQEKQVRC